MPVRPTSAERTPESLRGLLSEEQFKLYDLIWKRAIASQMAAARYDSTVMIFTVAGERFRASGRILTFDGFLKVYAEVDEESEKKGEEEKLQLLPSVETAELVVKVEELLEEKYSPAA